MDLVAKLNSDATLDGRSILLTREYLEGQISANKVFMHHQHLACLLVLPILAGCASHSSWPTKEQEACALSITERFAHKYIRPLSDPVALLAHDGKLIPADLSASSRVTYVEIIPKKGDRLVLFEDQSKRPPEGGMLTQVENADKIGIFYPATTDQKEIEVRVNYFCDIGDFVAVHVIVPNPLLTSKQK